MESYKGGCCKKVKEQTEEIKDLKAERDVLQRQLTIAVTTLKFYQCTGDPIRANDAIDRMKLMGPIP